MFYSKIVNYKKSVAWVLFITFYIQLIAPVLVHASANYPVLQYPLFTNAEKHFQWEAPSNENNLWTNEKKNDYKKVQRITQKTKKLLTGNNNKAKEDITDDGPGPTQPEMQSFQSVNNNNMVDLFTGDFSYNIPLLDVGGYPVNIHYNSGITMDQESSWVGLGWNINPGTINRNMRGLPDDFNGEDQIAKTLKLKDNKTVGITTGMDLEIVGCPLTFGSSYGVFHNTYNGWGNEIGTNAGITASFGSKGCMTASLSVTNNSQSGLNISPSLSMRMSSQDAKTQGSITIGTNYNSRTGIQGLQMSAQLRQQSNQTVIGDGQKQTMAKYGGASGISGEISFAKPSFTPTVSIPFTSRQFTYNMKIGAEFWSLHPDFMLQGSYSNQYIADEDTIRYIDSYGYLYTQNAQHRQDVLLDFNREKEVAFRGTTPNIAVPGYTYDIYSITGEGIGGMFRPYRNDIGMIYDHTMSTKSASGRFAADLGLGSIIHAGTDINIVFANTTNNEWRKDNVMSRYIENKFKDSLYENVYFKNPGEKVTVDQAFYDKIGDDKLVRVELNPINGKNASVVTATRNLVLVKDAKKIGTVGLDASVNRVQRDKRTQVISYLTADLASKVGLDTIIKSFAVNHFPSTTCNDNYAIINRVGDIRKGHHLSEITVLNTEGKRYVYGIPAYNIEQDDVTFSVNKSDGDNTTGLVTYNPGVDNTTQNKKGIDNYYNREKIPAYAHSFLLSAILSADYVDLTGDGVTEDDNGDAIKFNYSRVYGGNNPYQWRAPFNENTASYNEGLKTYSRDDKGSYSYGQKEIWYMNSIESKTMIATFVLAQDSLRFDSYGVNSENGGRDASVRLLRLKEINLYTKADFLKNGSSGAKPIKTVHFSYSYELCNGVPSSNSTGKLTLKKIWFTYNKNNKGKLNPYVFSYHSNNPDFNNKSYDRWGNYKDPADNPGTTGNTLTNGEYPYTLQKGVKDWDSTKASNNAAPWTLNQIKLPSGGLMKVTYESDDYAYVQDRRAMQMFSLAGLGYDSTDTPVPSLYEPGAKNKDYLYLFVKLQDPVSSVEEIKAKFLDSVKKIYFKLFVKMPGDKWGSGYEQIPCFAAWQSCGIKSGYSNKMIWIRIFDLKGNSPLATAAIQYLRINLPGKAFPYSEPGDNVTISDAVGMLLSVSANIKNTFDGFENEMRKKSICNEIDTAKSFIRLQNPYFKKLGGGLRVKKVEIFDNWHNMTNQTEASYGQYYDYSINSTVNGVKTRISSGVASYEPVLGKEENPFYLPIPYAENMAPLGPTDYIFTEEPLGEMFFPSPGVGYSRITVQTINSTKRSANGIEVTEFYTAKDFPTLFEYTALDNESKKSYANPIGNFLKFNAKRYITLSQGFKVELNDMHGKLKSQLSFAQTDLTKPIIATYNYYKVDNDYALKKHLSGKVSTVDSTNGVINANAQMGKDIDVFIDARQQTSKTVCPSLQVNIDWINTYPLVILPSIIFMPSFETNRYRSIAVTKIINRYGILDSVVHIDKGSKISTANMVYDGETGNVLLSRTQNEFDDPVYSANYPAYWAYSGMGSAYKNIGAIFYGASFLNGRLLYKGFTPNEIKRFFESGDELYFSGHIRRSTGSPSTCSGGTGPYVDSSIRIWAIDVAKASTTATGIYFIDKNGQPVNGNADSLKIIRSGKRNLTATSIGSITCLENPIKSFVGGTKLEFDSNKAVIAAGAIRFKDEWQIDSINYRKDTTVRSLVQLSPQSETLRARDNDLVGVALYKRNGNYSYTFSTQYTGYFISMSEYHAHVLPLLTFHIWTGYVSSVGFHNFDNIVPRNSIIATATLHLARPNPKFQFWKRNYDNAAYLSRSLHGSMSDYAVILPNNMASNAFNNIYPFDVDNGTRLHVDRTYPKLSNAYEPFNQDATAMMQGMLDDYYNHLGRPSLIINDVNTGAENLDMTVDSNQMVFKFASNGKHDSKPYFDITYYPPCNSGTAPFYSATPSPGYYCNSEPRDSFVCRAAINYLGTNPYRWGIWGNWRSDRSYVYYNLRKDSVATSTTNIRKDGQIKSFMPYWTFTSTFLQPSVDSSRWVWNSEINLVNNKGLELQNHDPLNRYNCAQYGYNQTLAVAVTQNSQSRESMVDGFEDYGYKTDTCKSCPDIRFINMVSSGTLVDTVSHTGLYSLRIPGNDSNSVSVPVIAQVADSIRPHVHITIDSTTIGPMPLLITGNGTGLNGRYIVFNNGIDPDTCNTRLDSMINFTAWGTGALDSLCEKSWRTKVEWTGYIQPRYSELYHFKASGSSRMQIWLNDSLITRHSPIQNTSGTYDLDTMSLIAGKLYPVKIIVNRAGENLLAVLKWSSDSEPENIIPPSQLYTINDTTGTTKTGYAQCLGMHNPLPEKVSLPHFSPTQNTKILVSAWVKEKDNSADTVTSFRNVQMKLSFTGSSAVFILKPTRNIIEGWQRIEDTLTIPAAATQMTIKLMSTNGSVPVYFDDIRFHPFNSNMRSYVYNPINIKLMAELDENNYASFYEYDDDGTLIRVKKETERGIKTINEARNALSGSQ